MPAGVQPLQMCVYHMSEPAAQTHQCGKVWGVSLEGQGQQVPAPAPGVAMPVAQALQLPTWRLAYGMGPLHHPAAGIG